MSDLTDLGLSSYEEQAYRSLLRLGRSTAGDVADESDVPQGRIYDVLNGLAARDLVTVQASREPRHYSAVDPDVAVDRLLAERRQELRAERERYERLAEEVATDLAGTAPSESRFWPVELGSADAAAGIREEFDRSETSIRTVIGPPYDGAPVERYRSEIDAFFDAVDGDLTVKLLATRAALDDAALERLRDAVRSTPAFEARTTAGVQLSYDVVDEREVVLSLPTPFGAADRLGAVVVDDADTAAILAERFESAWERAEPVETATAASDR